MFREVEAGDAIVVTGATFRLETLPAHGKRRDAEVFDPRAFCVKGSPECQPWADDRRLGSGLFRVLTGPFGANGYIWIETPSLFVNRFESTELCFAWLWQQF